MLPRESALENVALPLNYAGVKKPDRDNRPAAALDRAGLADRVELKPPQLSGGQKQLLNLAAIMAMHPSLLILDGPTSQLDPIAASDFLDTVKKINENTNCKATFYPLEDLDKLKEEMHSSYLFTNATGVGMKPLEGITYIPDPSFFRPDLIVTDVVYAPHETAMLKMARHAGCKTMNGQGMMLFQAIAAIELILGKRVDSEYMKEKLGISYVYED